MAFKSKTQLQTDSETVRTETLNKANTAQRVGQLFRDIVDSFLHQNDSSSLTAAKLEVASADLLSIDAVTPFTVFAAPGATNGIKVISLMVQGYASNGYNRDLQLKYANGDVIAVIPITNQEAKVYDITIGNVKVEKNDAIVLAADGAVTGGSNDLQLNISYITETFSGYTTL